ncbi:MAG: MFS transporter [Aristaeellaceae bacterium]
MFSFFTRLDKGDKRTLFTCFFGFCFSGILSMTMGSVMPDLKAAYHLSDATSGLLLSAHSAGNLVAGLVSGMIPLWLGQRRSITLLSAMAVLGYFMLTLCGVPAWLLLAFLLIGFGRGSITNFDNRMVNKLSGGSPAASNLLHSSFAVGAIGAPLVFLALRNAFSWRIALGFVLLFGCGCVLAFSRMRLKQDSLDRHNKGNTTWKFLRNPSFLILGGMMFGYMCSEYAINGWLVTYIQNKESLCAALAASGSDPASFSQTMASLLWVVILIGRLSCAVLSTRFPQKKMMLVCSAGMTVFYGVMLMSHSIAMVVFSVAGLGLCMAGICPMIYSDAAIFTNTYPMATSALLAMGSTGAIIMPTLVGALAEVFGFTGGMSAIYVSVVMLLLCAVLNVAVKTRFTPEMQKTAQA